MILTATREAQDYINSVPSLQRRILSFLFDGPCKLLDLVKRLQRTYDEYRFMKTEIVMEALAQLMRLKCINYSGDF